MNEADRPRPLVWLTLLVGGQLGAIGMFLGEGATLLAVWANLALAAVAIFVLLRALLALGCAERARLGVGLAVVAIALVLVLVAGPGGPNACVLADLGLRRRATSSKEWPAVRTWAREVAAGRADARAAPWPAVDLADRLGLATDEAEGQAGARGIDLGTSVYETGERWGVVLGDDTFAPVEDPACRYVEWAPGVWGYQRVRW